MWAIDLRSAIDFTSSIVKVKSRLEQVIEAVAAEPVYLGKESPWPIHEYVKQDMSEFTINVHFSPKPDLTYIRKLKPGKKGIPLRGFNIDVWRGNLFQDGPESVNPYPRDSDQWYGP